MPAAASFFHKVLAGCAVLGAAGGLGYAGWLALTPAEAEIQYRTARVERGPITAVVSAIGTVNAAATVHVGAPVAGRVIALSADYNSEVRRGQVLARIDPEPFELRVAQAQADVEASRRALAAAQGGVTALHAQVARARVASLDAQRELDRRQVLASRGFIAPAEVARAEAAHRDVQAAIAVAEADTAHQEAQVESARAVLRQRETALASARAELQRTFVRAPVDGIVIFRGVETGQTPGGGLDAAPLYTIARDLRDMQVEAIVSEADVGRLRAGQAASFTVDAFPRRSFEGRIAQLRKSPQRAGDGVAYTAVIAAPNADLALLPGMTARVQVPVASRTDALKVPVDALSFRTDETGPAGADYAQVWRLDASRRPEPVAVRLGVSDGRYAEIAEGQIAVGDTLVLGAAIPLPKAAKTGR